MIFRNLFRDLLALFYPELCAACNAGLTYSEQVICIQCRLDLPYTDFHTDPGNPMAKQLWGRFSFSAAASLLYFKKASAVQALVHRLKYSNQPEIGEMLGEIYGRRLKPYLNFAQADLIVPVPLHSSKKKKRGYNQSEHFAMGLSRAMGIAVSADNLLKISGTETQTKKSRFHRYQNMKDVFTVARPGLFAGKHIILADDVLTTGSTVEACCMEILQIPGASVSILTIAFTE